jgi:CheY-like chemotaxis protein
MKELRVLVVDDLFTNRHLLRELLKKMDYSFTMAENGKEAIEILSREPFDIILMDIEMPVMSGLETTRFIRERMTPPLTSIPIIALTAHDPRLFFEDFKDAGFDDIITKPYSLKRVQQIIQTHIKEK